MNILVGIIIVVVFLIILGIGVETFVSGVSKGAEKIGSSPIMKNATTEAAEFVKEIIGNATKN